MDGKILSIDSNKQKVEESSSGAQESKREEIDNVRANWEDKVCKLLNPQRPDTTVKTKIGLRQILTGEFVPWQKCDCSHCFL